jgi:nitroreductase
LREAAIAGIAGPGREETRMTERRADHQVDPLFLERWSPRAFDGSAMPEEDLLSLVEAARWAPSAFNSQPWRFVYAHRGDREWEPFLDLLIPFNREWAQTASVLLFVLSDRLPIRDTNGNPVSSHSHSFDAGAAWAYLALQAIRLGYHAHGMTGVDFERVREALAVPERYRIEAAVAVGRRGDPAVLSEKLRAREIPSGREPVSAFAFRGAFRA